MNATQPIAVIKQYTPKFTHKRVRSRCERAIGFSIGVLGDKPHKWSTRYIDKHFGQQQNKLSNYLRDVLLITTNDHWNHKSGICKEYKLNRLGVRYLRERLKQEHELTWFEFLNENSKSEINTLPHTIPYCITSFTPAPKLDYEQVRTWATSEFAQELTTCEFEYTDQSDRLFHPIQNIRSEFRSQLLAESGLKYDYDIQCCAPTLILQYAKKLGIRHELPVITAYVQNRDYFRQLLAHNADISLDTSKKLITALFNGARLGANIDFETTKMLNYDWVKIAYIKQDTFIVSLRDEVKQCWEIIKKNEPIRERVDLDGVISRERFDSKPKWRVYFRLERLVMNSIRSYLKSQRVRCLLMHDGWTCENLLDPNELVVHVKRETGYEIKIDYEIIN